MMTNEQLKGRILRRVKRVYYLQQILSPLLIKVYGFAVLFVGAASLVSLQNIVANMEGINTFSQFYSFMSAAFLHTELVVQVIALAAALLLILMMKDISRTPVHHEEGRAFSG